jgi:hypothetical protein
LPTEIEPDRIVGAPIHALELKNPREAGAGVSSNPFRYCSKKRSWNWPAQSYERGDHLSGGYFKSNNGVTTTSKEEESKMIVRRWFAEFWGKTFNPQVIDELAAPNMLLQYSLHAP